MPGQGHDESNFAPPANPEPVGLRKFLSRDRKGMADQPSVHGKQPQTFLLSLDQQQLVKRVIVVKRYFKFAGGMAHGHRQERQILFFQCGSDILRGEAALACSPDRWRAWCLRRISQMETALT